MKKLTALSVALFLFFCFAAPLSFAGDFSVAGKPSIKQGVDVSSAISVQSKMYLQIKNIALNAAFEMAKDIKSLSITASENTALSQMPAEAGVLALNYSCSLVKLASYKPFAALSFVNVKGNAAIWFFVIVLFLLLLKYLGMFYLSHNKLKNNIKWKSFTRKLIFAGIFFSEGNF